MTEGTDHCCVLDASAILALAEDEPGAAQVAACVEGGIVSSVNWAEVLQKAVAADIDIVRLIREFGSLGLRIEPFTQEDAEISANVWLRNQNAGLSLADRACLALASRLGLPAVTADRAWATVEVGADVSVVR